MKSSSPCVEWGRGWFSPALLKKNVTRFWPIWGIYTAILFFALPMEIFLAVREESGLRNLTEAMLAASVLLGVFFGLVAAMALFSYLMNPKATQMFHALPIRREGLFITNWITGLSFFLIPNLVILLVSLIASGMVGVRGWPYLLLWFALGTAAPMFFFCFAVLCALFTGHILALPAFYGILNVLVVGVCTLLDAAGGELLYNYVGLELAGSTFARWCTPAFQIIYLLLKGDFLANGVAAAVGYCVVLGAAFTLVALAVYRHRQLERAGDLVTVGWVRPVFQWGFGACIGLTVGLVIYGNFFRAQGPWAYIGAVSVCAVLGAFAGRMLLKKTLRVFVDGWKSCMALGLAVFLLMAGVKVDAFGFQRWTPAPDRVASVRLTRLTTYPSDGAWYLNVEITDPELIARVTDLHKALNDALPELKESGRQGVWESWDAGDQLCGPAGISFYYTMADGRTVARQYSDVPVYAADLEEPDTYTYQLSALVNDPEIEALSYSWEGMDQLSDLRATGGWIGPVAALPQEIAKMAEDGEEQADGASTHKVLDWDGSWEEYTLDVGEAGMLWEAFWEDLEAGRIERYLLLGTEQEENCYESSITLSFSWSMVSKEGDRHTESSDLTFVPQKSQTSVMAVLEELGLKDRLAHD